MECELQLLARIERMERRLQLISNAPRDKRLFQPLERWQPEAEDFWEGEEGAQATSPKNLAYSRDGKVQKRCVSGKKWNWYQCQLIGWNCTCFLSCLFVFIIALCSRPHRKFGLSDPKTPTQKPRGKAAKFGSQKTEAGGPLSCQRDLHKNEPLEEMGYGQSAGQAAAMHSVKEEPLETMCMEELPYMTTTEMYLCCWKQPPLSPLREESPKKEEDVDSEWNHSSYSLLDSYLTMWPGVGNIVGEHCLQGNSLPVSSQTVMYIFCYWLNSYWSCLLPFCVFVLSSILEGEQYGAAEW